MLLPATVVAEDRSQVRAILGSIDDADGLIRAARITCPHFFVSTFLRQCIGS